MMGVVVGIAVGLFIDLSRQNTEVVEANGETSTTTATSTVWVEGENFRIEVVPTKIEWTPERIEQEVRATFPEAPEVAVAIMKAEGGHNPRAHNNEAHRDRHGNVICHSSRGIMQIGCIHRMNDLDGLYDVKTNLQEAREIYDDVGWSAWGAYTNGSYKRFL